MFHTTIPSHFGYSNFAASSNFALNYVKYLTIMQLKLLNLWYEVAFK